MVQGEGLQSGRQGSNRGIHDYKFIITGHFTSNIARQSEEGRRQTIFESYQTRHTLQVLNSKIDFIQPLRANLATLTKNINVKPGQTNTCPTKKARRTVKRKRRLKDDQIPSKSTFDPKWKSTPTKAQKKTNQILNLNQTQVMGPVVYRSPSTKKVKWNTQH